MASPGRAASLVPLATFGGGDGWREPFEILAGDTPGTDSQSPGLDYNYLKIGNLERGLAYNPTTDHLILVSRSAAGNGIRILDGMTGVDIGALNQGSGIISGGTFTTDMIGVADDGAIYVGNLTTNTTTTAFNIYRWADESSTPTLVYSGAPLAGARIGDSLDVIGSGAATQLVAGYGNTPTVAGNNSFALFKTTDGLNFSATHVDVASAPPDAGDFRLGITFQDADTVLGRQPASPGSVPNPNVRVVDVSGATGTLVGSYLTDGSGLNGMDFAMIQSKPLLAMVNINSPSNVFVYDISDYATHVDVAEATAATTHDPNGNGTGQVKFGAMSGNTAIVYAMNTNNGIQAFTLTLDPVVVNNGDYNGNGFVDAADYVVWRDMEGQAVTPNSEADGDGDGTIGPGDYDYWRARFGNAIGSGAEVGAAVPEPSALALVLFAALGCLAPRRNR
jgi:hypothetical protein